MKFACTWRKLKINILRRPFCWSLDFGREEAAETLAGLLQADRLREFGWSEPAALGNWIEGDYWETLAGICRVTLTERGASASWPTEGFWLGSGCPGELAGIWLPGENWLGFWLGSGCPGKIRIFLENLNFGQNHPERPIFTSKTLESTN